jgi:hypothetical protein
MHLAGNPNNPYFLVAALNCRLKQGIIHHYHMFRLSAGNYFLPGGGYLRLGSPGALVIKSSQEAAVYQARFQGVN